MFVHNGSLDNFEELRDMLTKQGVTLSSETDTELIAQLIGQDLEKGKTLLESMGNTIQRHLRGKWGLVAIDKNDPKKIIVARNGSPILVGLHEDCIIIASERIAFEKYTDNFI